MGIWIYTYIYKYHSKKAICDRDKLIYSVVRYNNHIWKGTYRDCSRRAGRSMQARWWRALHSYETMAKTKYFTLGCNKLLMWVDRKGLLNSKPLETIGNPKLLTPNNGDTQSSERLTLYML